LRRILVVIQFALTVILIICTGVVYSQLDYIRTKDLGFDKDNILTISMNEQIQKNYDVAKQELLQNPDIINVTSATSPPLNITNFNYVYWEGKSPEESVHFRWLKVSHDYFKTFNIKLAQGRTFSDKFSLDSLKYIVNETALKFMELKEPLGKLFAIQVFKGEIIGIVKDFNNNSLHTDIKKVVFILTPAVDHDYMFVKMKPDNFADTVNDVKTTLTKLAPGFPLQYQFLDEFFDIQYKSEQQIGTIFRYFAILAIFISCLGLYGLVSFTAEQKTKEIGIRKVYGASVQNIIYMISREFVRLVILSSVIAFPVAYYVMSRWLQNYAFYTSLNIWIFLVSAALSIIITILTVWYQAFKAARANPINSLKYE
jgi:ABC-type antimicrobial peptide transport system permease subunit